MNRRPSPSRTRRVVLAAIFSGRRVLRTVFSTEYSAHAIPPSAFPRISTARTCNCAVPPSPRSPHTPARPRALPPLLVCALALPPLTITTRRADHAASRCRVADRLAPASPLAKSAASLSELLRLCPPPALAAPGLDAAAPSAAGSSVGPAPPCEARAAQPARVRRATGVRDASADADARGRAAHLGGGANGELAQWLCVVASSLALMTTCVHARPAYTRVCHGLTCSMMLLSPCAQGGGRRGCRVQRP